jgi:hypothetical protein
MSHFLFVLTLCVATTLAAVQLTADSASDPNILHIDRTEIVAIDAFTRTLEDGTTLVYDRKIIVHGAGFLGTAVWPKVELGGKQAWGVENPDSQTLTIYLPSNMVGTLQLEVTMPGQSAKASVGN